MAEITRRTALAAPLLALPALARAQSWRPPGQARIVVPAAAGGTTDIMGRLVAQFLQARWGTPVVVDNRAGAGGTIGTLEMVRARPDGTTLLLGNIGPQAIAYSLFRNLPYRPDQLVPIAGTIGGPNVLVCTPPSGPIRSPSSRRCCGRGRARSPTPPQVSGSRRISRRSGCCS